MPRPKSNDGHRETRRLGSKPWKGFGSTPTTSSPLVSSNCRALQQAPTTEAGEVSGGRAHHLRDTRRPSFVARLQRTCSGPEYAPGPPRSTFLRPALHEGRSTRSTVCSARHPPGRARPTGLVSRRCAVPCRIECDADRSAARPDRLNRATGLGRRGRRGVPRSLANGSQSEHARAQALTYPVGPTPREIAYLSSHDTRT